MREKKRNKKILSLLIATLMIISMLPSSVFAAADDVMIEEYADMVTEEADVVDDVAEETAEVPDAVEQEADEQKVEADLAGASEVVSATAEGILSGGKMTFDAVLDGVSVYAAVPASRAPRGSVMTADLVDVSDFADAISAKIYGKDVSALKGLELHFYNKKGKEITHINTSDVTITADAMDADSYALCRLNGNSVGVVKKADASAFTFKEKKAYTYAIVGLVDDGVLRATAETGSNGVKSFNLDNIEVIAPKDAFGDDVAMEASDVTDDAATEEEALVGSSEDEVIAAYEISFYDEDGVEQQPEKEVTVKIATALDMSKNYKLIHIADNGETNEVENAVFTESGVEFVADSFSVYAVVAETRAETKAETNDISFSVPMRGEPTINASKTVTDNDGDGIYELALNVNATSQQSTDTDVTKSNVVMVIDVSGSMGNDDSYVYYGTYTYNAGTYNNYRYYSSSTNQNQRLYYRNGAWRTSNSNNGTRYYGTVYAWETRLHATQRAACAVVDALLEKNQNEDGITDLFEITVVKFANLTATNNYNGTETIIRDSTDGTAIKNAINALSSGGGTNWEAALNLAKTEADYFKNTDPSTDSEKPEKISVIFLTDGFPTYYVNNNGNQGGDGGENANNIATSYTQARPSARTIVSSGYTLYNIFAFGSDTTTYNSHNGFAYLRALTNYAYGSGTTDNYNETANTRQYSFNAKSTDDLVAAFQTIINHITNSVGYAGVNLSDGVSLGATSTSVAVNGNAKEETMRYTVKDASDKISYTVKINSSGAATFTIYNADGTTTTLTDSSPETVTTVIKGTTYTSKVYSVTVGSGEDAKTYKMSPATIDADTGMVKWDLAGLGILENGYTYTVAFDVWPNQLAYDIAADLNNGLYATVDEALDAYHVTDATERQHITEAIVHNDDGSYSLYTNYSQDVEYYPATSHTDDDGNVTWEYGEKQNHPLQQPDPIPLKGSHLPLAKIWESDLAIAELNEVLWENGEVGGTSKEYQITLNVWKADTEAELDELVNEGDTDKAYISKVLGWDSDTSQYIFERDAAVAPGVMVNLEEAEELGFDITETSNIRSFTNDEGTTLQYYVIEIGHYYYVTEEGSDLHFELETELYHPMIVDGTLYNVFFGEGQTVDRMDPMYAVTATNTLKGGLNIFKVVSTSQIAVESGEIRNVTEPVDEDGLETVTDEFTYEIKIWKVDESGNKIAVFTTPDQIDEEVVKTKSGSVGYRIFSEPSLNDDDEIVYGTSERGAILTADDPYAELANGIFATIENGETTITLTMPANGEIRLVNLPSGTEYTVKEIVDTAGSYTYAATESQVKKSETETTDPVVSVNNEVTGTVAGNTASILTYYNWASNFYVYHSKDNTIEKISFADPRVAGTFEGGEYKYTFNIAAETKENALYGGYFKAYKGSGMTDAQIIAAAYENTDNAGYAYTTKEESTSNWATDSSGKAYDGATAGQWVKKNAYTENGLAMDPAVNTVYYLKEVPSQYFRPALYYVYDDVSPEKDIKKLYFMVPTDDNLYQLVCGRPIDLTENKKLYGTFKVTNAAGSEEAIAITNVNSKLKRGYLTVWDGASFMIENTKYEWIPNFVTLDSVEVTSYVERVINTGDLCYGENASNFKTTDSAIDSSVATYSKP